MNIKAIETVYNGYKFRSRLEGRWAVFFDALGIEYQYEPEGFDVAGVWYLPDFWLPELKLWVEIKGNLGYKELKLCESLRDNQNWPVICIQGQPGKEKIHFYASDMTDSSAGHFETHDAFWVFCDGAATIHPNPSSNREREIYTQDLELIECFTNPMKKDYALEPVKSGYLAARQARFEHGETPFFNPYYKISEARRKELFDFGQECANQLELDLLHAPKESRIEYAFLFAFKWARLFSSFWCHLALIAKDETARILLDGIELPHTEDNINIIRLGINAGMSYPYPEPEDLTKPFRLLEKTNARTE